MPRRDHGSVPDDDRLLERLGQALAVPVPELADADVQRLRRMVGRMGRSRRLARRKAGGLATVTPLAPFAAAARRSRPAGNASA